jgi:hypothetical protein
LGAFGVIFIVMPFTLSRTAFFADYRLPSAVAFIALASFGWRRTSPARSDILRLLLSVCLIVRVGSVFSDWQAAQAVIGEYDTALQLVPPGSRLLVYMGNTPFGDRNPSLRHVPVLAAAMHGVFDPDTFTNGTESNGFQLLNLKPDFRDYWMDAPWPNPWRIYDIRRFDYLVEIQPHPYPFLSRWLHRVGFTLSQDSVTQSPVKIPAGITLDEIKRGRTFVLYRIGQ